MSQKIHKGFKVLKERVLPKLEGFQDDILKHDKEQLTGYEGRFISASRSSGTHLVLMDTILLPDNWDGKTVDELIRRRFDWAISFMEANKYFLLIEDDGSSREISLSEAKGFVHDRMHKELGLVKQAEKINMRDISFDLFYFIKENGKRWKSKLKELWLSNSTPPSLSRLRNRFDHKILSDINFDASMQSIEQLLTVKYFDAQAKAA